MINKLILKIKSIYDDYHYNLVDTISQKLSKISYHKFQ